MPQRRIREDKIQPTRHYSTKQEKQVASKFDGSRTLNSGATPYQKGDISLENFLLECKTKVKHSESITIQKEWLEKNEKEALFMGKPYSALVFNFGPNETNYYVIDEYLFETLIGKTDTK
jgi:hypothetical protein